MLQSETEYIDRKLAPTKSLLHRAAGRMGDTAVQGHNRKWSAPFDNVIGAGRDHERDFNTDRLRRPQIDHELEFGRLDDSIHAAAVATHAGFEPEQNLLKTAATRTKAPIDATSTSRHGMMCENATHSR